MRTNGARARRSQRGGVLLFALIAVGMVAMMATALLQESSATMRRQAGALETRRSFYLAEAGLAEAYSGLIVGKTGNVGTRERPAALGSGLFWVEATAVDAQHVQLLSTGMSGLGRAVLSIAAERGEQSVASLGVFASSALTIPPGSQIAGYDPQAADAPPSQPPAPPTGILEASAPAIGRIGSNEDIAVQGTAKKPTTVHADLGAGPDHHATLAKAVKHVGKNQPRSAAAPLPPIEPPFTPDEPGIHQKGPHALIIPSGQVGLEFLKVAAGARVIVQGPCELVVNHLSVAKKGQVQFDTLLGPVSMWVLSGAELSAGSSVSTTGKDSARMLLQAPNESELSLLSTGSFHGVVYAPQGKVTVGPNLQIYGALVANELVIQPGAKLYFDRHLDEVAAELALPKLMSWRIVELATEARAGTARDPFTLLGVDPTTLPRPAAAHEDQPLHVVYVDDLGVTRTYDGMESGFDWTNVQSVSELTRSGQSVLPLNDPNPPPPPPPPSSAMLDAINSAMPLGALKNLLVDNSPLTSVEIVAAINRTPAFSSSDLKNVIVENTPLGSTELMAIFERADPVSPSDFKEMLLQSSPLPLDVLARVIAGPHNLTPSDLSAVLGAQ